ncbi:MAG: hypothetical protein JWR79_28 [Tardiphaga sp.]|nr:hypothetical protein [Tardiphaga sp.]
MLARMTRRMIFSPHALAENNSLCKTLRTIAASLFSRMACLSLKTDFMMVIEDDRRATMRGSTPQSSRLSARALPSHAAGRIELLAFYAAFALISAVVFGTLSIHPF